MSRALRIVSIGLAYALYRWLETDHGAGAALLVAAGSLVVSYSLINRYGLRRRERSGLLQVGQTILGLGLVAAGLLVILR